MATAFLCAWLAWSPGLNEARPAAARSAGEPAAGERRPARPRLLTDIGAAAAGALAIALLKPDIREALFRDASLSNVLRNFAHPIEQVRIGSRRDRDPFWVNSVAHPGLFALEALALKRRGYGDGGAFVFTQAHSVLWEFAVEGAAFEPSGKDLVADAAGAALAIWVLRPVAERSARRLASGVGRPWDHVLRWLDPVAALAGPSRPTLLLQPAWRPVGVAWQLTATF